MGEHNERINRIVTTMLGVAGHHKDRLHELQKTEWNLYYAICLILLASFYFLISSSRSLFVDMAEGICFALTNFHLEAGENEIRCIRAGISTLFAVVFYVGIAYFYLVLFYENNYRSIVQSRTRFYYYLNHAINACYEDKENVSTDAGMVKNRKPPAFRYEITNYFSGIEKECHNFDGLDGADVEVLNWIKKKDCVKVEEVVLPDLLHNLCKNYRYSGVYRSRRYIMLKVISLEILATSVISYLAPISNPAR